VVDLPLFRVLRFVLVTRFSRPLLVFMLAFLVYGIVLGSFLKITSGLEYYFIGLIAFTSSISALVGGLAVLKSDLDYLLVLPLDRKELTLSLYLSQFLASSGFLVIFVAPYIKSYFAHYYLGYELSILFLVCVALLATSLTVVVHPLDIKQRALVALVIGVWFISPTLGFEVSPTALLKGYTLFGVSTLVPLTLVVTSLAVRELLHADIAVFRTLGRRASTSFGYQASFLNKSPIRAIYAHYLSLLELAGRVNVSGNVSYTSARVRLRYALAATTALSLIYLFFSLKARNDSVLFALTTGSSFLPLFVAQSGLSNERAWLAFVALKPSTYLRHFLLAKSVSTFALVFPFVVVNVLLYFLGFKNALNTALFFAFCIPWIVVPSIYLSARFNPVQVKDTSVNPSQFNLKQLVSAIPVYAVILLGVSSVISLYIALGVSVAVLVISVFLIFNERTLEALVYRLSEAGFV